MEFPTTAMAALFFFMFLTVPFSVKEVSAQMPSCAQKLVPCAQYMNVATPPASCCDPLKDAITNELTCLCGLYNAPGFFKNLGINETDALTLPTRCNLSNDLSTCSKASSPTNSASIPPPPPPPGTSKSDRNGVGVGAVSWTVLSCAMILIFH